MKASNPVEENFVNKFVQVSKYHYSHYQCPKPHAGSYLSVLPSNLTKDWNQCPEFGSLLKRIYTYQQILTSAYYAQNRNKFIVQASNCTVKNTYPWSFIMGHSAT